MDLQLNRELELTNVLARAAGAVLLRHYHSPFRVEQKMNALQEMEEVTAADREANDMIVQKLSEEFPDDGILAEESKDTERRLEKERVWLIDPMDGTKNFVQRDGDFAVQIGLTDGMHVEITSGIKAGEMVIVDGQAGLPDGAEISIGGEEGAKKPAAGDAKDEDDKK